MSTNEIALYTVFLFFFLTTAGLFVAFAILMDPPILILAALIVGAVASLMSVFAIVSILTMK